MTVPPIDQLVPQRDVPAGHYDLDAARHARLVEHTFGSGVFETVDGAAAHPVFAHLASHCGKGWSFPEFLEHVGADLDDGLVFGHGAFAFARPLRVGGRYRVEAAITDVTRKTGRRVGVFDAITMTHQLWDEDDGQFVLRSSETTIVPRSAREDAPDPADPVPEGDVQLPPDALTHEVGPVSVLDIEAIMEVMGDTNPVHLDEDLARRKGYRGAVNQGPANLAYVLAALASWRGGLADLTGLTFRFRDTVTSGDRPVVVAAPDAGEARGVAAFLWLPGVGPAVDVAATFAAPARPIDLGARDG